MSDGRLYMTSADILLNHSIKPSVLRVMIYDYLKSHRTHPTADDIYSHLLKDAPTLSKTTVYNTLKLFVDKKVARTVTIDGFQTRYDGYIDDHGHFRCNHCHKLFDFEISEISDSNLEGFRFDTKDVYYTGVCKNCIQKN